jgi:hypothetical protein
MVHITAQGLEFFGKITLSNYKIYNTNINSKPSFTQNITINVFRFIRVLFLFKYTYVV